ncbi:MAG: hypothetical protein WCI51_15730 [Lentisphaerota bacterium]
MEPLNLFRIFTEPLEDAGLQYMAVGSVASMIYGIPRFTHDLDIVMLLPAAVAEHLGERFPSENFYCPPVEIIKIEMARSLHGHFNLIHHETGCKADIYLFNRDKLHAWGLMRRRRIELPEGCGLWVAPPEYVIVRKLEYFREGGSEKHLNDIAGMYEVSGEQIDAASLNMWINEKNLLPEWARLQLVLRPLINA